MTMRFREGMELHQFDESRFFRFSKWVPNNGMRSDLGPCLEWTGGKNDGYGQFTYNNRHGYAHRYAWERVNGSIPGDLTVDHLCRNRACVNLQHLELCTGEENFQRGVAARRTTGKCRHGHEYTEENTFMWNGKRQCIVCRTRARREYDAKRSLRRKLERES